MLKTFSLLALAFAASGAAAQTATYKVDSDGIAKPLTGTPGNAARGKALLAARGAAPCLDCHVITDKGMPKGGDKGPSLDGVGAVRLCQRGQRQGDAGVPQVRRERPQAQRAGSRRRRRLSRHAEEVIPIPLHSDDQSTSFARSTPSVSGAVGQCYRDCTQGPAPNR
jgi:hypothetical protein